MQAPTPCAPAGSCKANRLERSLLSHRAAQEVAPDRVRRLRGADYPAATPAIFASRASVAYSSRSRLISSAGVLLCASEPASITSC